MQNGGRPVAPRPINHVGIGVPDVEAAIRWYGEVMGFVLVSGPVDVRSDAPSGDQALDVLGPTFRHMRLAHLAGANGVGLELFELIDPPHERRPDVVEYWKSNTFHFCVTDPDIEAMVERIKTNGGTQLSRIWNERDASGDYRMCYCRDPFGTIVEIYTHSYELLQGHR